MRFQYPALASVIALALAGCHSGGNSDTSNPVIPVIGSTATAAPNSIGASAAPTAAAASSMPSAAAATPNAGSAGATPQPSSVVTTPKPTSTATAAPSTAPTATPKATAVPTNLPGTSSTIAPGISTIQIPMYSPAPSPSAVTQTLTFNSGLSTITRVKVFNSGSVDINFPLTDTMKGGTSTATLASYSTFDSNLPKIDGATNILALISLQAGTNNTTYGVCSPDIPFVADAKANLVYTSSGTPSGTFHVAYYTPVNDHAWHTGIGSSDIGKYNINLNYAVPSGTLLGTFSVPFSPSSPLCLRNPIPTYFALYQ